MRLAGLRQPAAAILGVLGLVVGSTAAFAGSATAAPGDLTSTLSLDCETAVPSASGTPSINPFDWDAEITLSAIRPADSTTVTVIAQFSDMPPISPVPMNNYAVTGEVGLTLGGASTTLTVPAGSTVTNDGPSRPVPVPDYRGTLTSSADELEAEFADLEMTIMGIVTDCKPATSGALGVVTIVEGEVPTPTPTPTTTTSATATPTATATATSTSGSKGEPAKGKATYDCILNPLSTEFEYTPTITVNGYRENESDPVSLVASMTDLPGKSPVPIIGPMDYTLDLEVGGEKVTLTSSGDVDAGPYDEVPVADLKGTVDVDGDELEVATTGFTFDFPSGGVGAECTADRAVLGTMIVGSEPIDSGGGDDGGSGGGDTSAGDLPKTGGGDSTPVVLLWAGAFVLLGAGALLAVPGRARRLREH